MIKLHDIIKKAAEARAIEHLGEERYKETPAFAQPILDDFKAGAEFVIDNIMVLQNHFPLVGLVTIQVDPNDPDSKMVAAKTSGINPRELVDLLHRFAQGTLDKSLEDKVLVLMPREEARRRDAFQETMKAVNATWVPSKPD